MAGATSGHAAHATLRSPIDGRGAIDLHAHIVTESYREACIQGGHGQPDGIPELPRWSSADAIGVMDRVGIDSAVLSVSSPGIFFGDESAAIDLCTVVNDESAAVVKEHPDRFGFAASLPLPDVDASIREVRRVYDGVQTDAISLLTNYGGLYLGDPRMDALLDVLDGYNAVVLIHPTSPPCWQQLSLGRPRPMIEFPLDTTRAVFNLALNGCFDRYPGIRWVVPHSGAAVQVLADRVHLFAQAWATKAEDAVDVLGGLQRLYYDLAGVPLPRSLPALLQLVSSGQIVYGSDYPFTPEPYVEKFARDLTDADVAQLRPLHATLRSNAETLFPRFAQPSA